MLQARVAQLEAVFRDIAATRMADVPICHPGLQVQAVDFELLQEEPDIAFGVLVTPWFMNLMRLPVAGDAPAALRERESARRAQLGHTFEFLGAHEPALGAFESCSLYSPMFEFADHEAAVATAREVLAQIRRPPEPQPAPLPAGTLDTPGMPDAPWPSMAAGAPSAMGSLATAGSPVSASAPHAARVTTAAGATTAAEPVPSRRGFLFGRGGRQGPGA